MSFLKHADLCTHDFALELVGEEGGFHGKLAYSQQMFAESIGQRFSASFEVPSHPSKTSVINCAKIQPCLSGCSRCLGTTI